MKKIVIATDFQKSSDSAMSYATFLTIQFKAELSVVHVYYPMISSDPNFAYDNVTPIVLQEEMIHIYEQRLKETIEALKEKGIEATSELIVGSLSASVSDYAQKRGADLIIVGKTMDNSFIDRLIGSNASSIVKNTNVPVLIVPVGSHKPGFDSILYGTELETEEKAVLTSVFEFAKKFHSKVALVKINADFELDIQDDNQMLEDIQKSFGADSFTFETVKAGKVSEGLLQEAHKKNADLLVVARHHHNFLSEIINPGKSKEIINKADLPLLVYDLEA